MNAIESVPVTLRSRRDLRLRHPDPAMCLPHPGDCIDCAWGIVGPDSPGYQPGSPLPVDLSDFIDLPGSYTGHCGHNRIVQHRSTGDVFVIRGSRLYAANPASEAFDRYRPVMGLPATV